MLSGQNPQRGPLSITVCLSESHLFVFEQRWISPIFLFLLVSQRMVQTKPTGFFEHDKSSSRGQTTQRPNAREALIIEWNIDASGSSCQGPQTLVGWWLEAPGPAPEGLPGEKKTACLNGFKLGFLPWNSTSHSGQESLATPDQSYFGMVKRLCAIFLRIGQKWKHSIF